MRINVYSQELTNEVLLVEKGANTGIKYHAAQLVLHSSDRLHHPPADDDRSAVTFGCRNLSTVAKKWQRHSKKLLRFFALRHQKPASTNDFYNQQ